MPDLRAVPGDPTSPATGAIRGMINMLQKLRKDVRADYVACVFDAPGPTFRDDIYPDYKATRSPMPPDLRAQIDADPRSGAPARLEGAERARRRGRRRDRHAGLHGHRARLSDRHLQRRQGPEPAGQRARHRHRHHERPQARRGRRRGRVRRAAAADGGLPDAGRRLGRQRAGRGQGRPQDGGEAAAGIRLARRPGGARRTRSRAPSARTCARRWTGCPRAASW